MGDRRKKERYKYLLESGHSTEKSTMQSTQLRPKSLLSLSSGLKSQLCRLSTKAPLSETLSASSRIQQWYLIVVSSDAVNWGSQLCFLSVAVAGSMKRENRVARQPQARERTLEPGHRTNPVIVSSRVSDPGLGRQNATSCSTLNGYSTSLMIGGCVVCRLRLIWIGQDLRDYHSNMVVLQSTSPSSQSRSAA